MIDLFLCHTLKHSATYDVQDVEICVEGGSIFINCVFASGSQAKGCHVEIRNSSVSDLNISRSGSPPSRTAKQTVTGLTPGSYEVFIFDWESDDSFSPTPSNVSYANVTGFLTLNTSEVDNSSALPMPVTAPEPSLTTGRRTMIVAIAIK